MKASYQCKLTRITTEQHYLTVEAESQEQAEALIDKVLACLEAGLQVSYSDTPLCFVPAPTEAIKYSRDEVSKTEEY